MFDIEGGAGMAVTQEIFEKLEILTDAAKYDVACTSSGSSRKGRQGMMGNTVAGGICHCFAADGRCISLLKILQTNECVYDCKYCQNRMSNDVKRAGFTPEEIAELTISFYRRNYIEGLFLSSGIVKSPTYTMELMYQAIYLLRTTYHFNGYIHVKAIPGTSDELITNMGYLVDRMSVNLELPTADGLARLAPGKTRDKILRPMRQIQTGIARQLEQEGRLESRGAWLPQKERGEIQIPGDGRYGIGGKAIGKGEKECLQADKGILSLNQTETKMDWGRNGDKVKGFMRSKEPGGTDERVGRTHTPEIPRVIPGHSIYGSFGLGNISNSKNYFVPGGQSTQLIVGATPESDYQMVAVAEALYRNFGLKRVFYSAFIKVNEDSLLPDLPDGPPLLREHRLYQADWLLRFYGFRAEELLDERRPYFNVMLDPKEDWAVRHLECFPVEINRSPYGDLLRVPGIGVKSARRILAARRSTKLTFQDLKKLGVVLKRAVYFITCSGRMMYPTKLEEDYIVRNLTDPKDRIRFGSDGMSYRQMTLFDDGMFPNGVRQEEKLII